MKWVEGGELRRLMSWNREAGAASGVRSSELMLWLVIVSNLQCRVVAEVESERAEQLIVIVGVKHQNWPVECWRL